MPTGCRTEDAARQVLADLERKAERVRAGLITPAEARTAEHLTTPVAEHIDAYIGSLEAKGASRGHVRESRRILAAVFSSCEFRTLADFDRGAFERHLNRRRQAKVSARTRNADREALVTFANWCVEMGRMTANPFKGVPKADQKADRRRQRRAMTADELSRLLDVAQRRPIIDAMTVHRGKRKGQAVANPGLETRERLEALGRERALIYKTMVLTGLRRGELASLTVGQLRLDEPTAYAELDAADEKNREGNAVPIRADLADDLRSWLADKVADARKAAMRNGEPVPAGLPGDTPLFTVPAGLVRILDRDLRLAGIPKRDDRGRTFDVHALRTTFGTLLSKGGVPLRTAQAAMRHSDPSLTANVYTDPRLLDIHGALDVLPTLPLAAGPDAGRDSLQATGTDDHHPLAPPLALTWCKPSASEAYADTTKAELPNSIGPPGLAGKACIPGDFAGFQGGNEKGLRVETTGIEPATSWLQTRRSPD